MPAATTSVDPVLKTWATEYQARVVDAVNEHGGITKAAKALGITQSAASDSLRRLRHLAESKGYAPGHPGFSRAVPESFVAKGVSVYHPAVVERDAEGKVTKVVEPAAWVKANLKQEAYNEALREAVASFIEEIPKLEAPEGPREYSTDVIPWIQIGDAHIGMLAHAAETGENFDLKIAERELCAAIGMLIDEMPACERVVINDLGDATHYDNFSGTTAASGHALDYDGRFPKMLRVYSRTMRFIVDKALTKAQTVDVIINQGNHSRINDFWMRELLEVAYGHTGRVNVLNNDSVFIPYRMGNTLVMVHHSDKCRPQDLVGVLTSDFRKDFGETEHHYIDIGHVHHHFVSKEHPSVIIESWNHLAASDKWAHDAGYRSRKAITCVLRSKTFGDIGRRVLPVQEVRARLGSAVKAAKPVFTV